MKHWLMMQNFTALNTMYRKTPGKQTTYRSPAGNEKQIDHIIIKRRHLKFNEDAEANDMIDMGSGHRCVMATFAITTPKKDGLSPQNKKKDKLETTRQDIRKQTDKKTGKEESELETRYQEIIEKIKEKAEAAKKELSQSEEKPMKQKKQQHKQKV